MNQIKNTTNKWGSLAILCAAQFMVIMDTSIIGVALPAIQKDLNYTPSELQWIFNAYVITFGGVLLLGGKLSDIFGPKNIGRGIQGLGAALIAPSAMTLLMTIFTDPKELGKAFGFWGASAAAGGSAGVFLGGVLTEYASWRWTFFINVPIGLLVMLAGAAILIKGNKIKGTISYISGLLITGSMTLIVYTLVMIEKNGWTSGMTLGLFALGLALLIAFILIQRTSQSALLPLTIFKAPNLSAGNLIMLLLAGAWIPLWFYLNLYLQQTLNYSAFYSGLALLPMTIIIMVLMVGVTGKLIAKFGFKHNLVVGLAVLTISLIWFSNVPVDGNFVGHVLGASILGAIGMSLAYIPGTMASISGAKPQESGLASGLVNTTYQIGSAIGLAIAVAVATSSTNNSIAEGQTETDAINNGFQMAFMAAAVISAIATIISLIAIKQNK